MAFIIITFICLFCTHWQLAGDYCSDFHDHSCPYVYVNGDYLCQQVNTADGSFCFEKNGSFESNCYVYGYSSGCGVSIDQHGVDCIFDDLCPLSSIKPYLRSCCHPKLTTSGVTSCSELSGPNCNSGSISNLVCISNGDQCRRKECSDFNTKTACPSNLGCVWLNSGSNEFCGNRSFSDQCDYYTSEFDCENSTTSCVWLDDKGCRNTYFELCSILDSDDCDTVLSRNTVYCVSDGNGSCRRKLCSDQSDTAGSYWSYQACMTDSQCTWVGNQTQGRCDFTSSGKFLCSEYLDQYNCDNYGRDCIWVYSNNMNGLGTCYPVSDEIPCTKYGRETQCDWYSNHKCMWNSSSLKCVASSDVSECLDLSSMTCEDNEYHTKVSCVWSGSSCQANSCGSGKTVTECGTSCVWLRNENNTGGVCLPSWRLASCDQYANKEQCQNDSTLEGGCAWIANEGYQGCRAFSDWSTDCEYLTTANNCTGGSATTHCVWTPKPSTGATWIDNEFGGHCGCDCGGEVSERLCGEGCRRDSCTYTSGSRICKLNVDLECSDYRSADSACRSEMGCYVNGSACRKISTTCAGAVYNTECDNVYDLESPFSKSCSWDNSGTTRVCRISKCTDFTSSNCYLREGCISLSPTVCQYIQDAECGDMNFSTCNGALLSIGLDCKWVYSSDRGSSGTCHPSNSLTCNDYFTVFQCRGHTPTPCVYSYDISTPACVEAINVTDCGWMTSFPSYTSDDRDVCNNNTLHSQVNCEWSSSNRCISSSCGDKSEDACTGDCKWLLDSAGTGGTCVSVLSISSCGLYQNQIQCETETTSPPSSVVCGWRIDGENTAVCAVLVNFERNCPSIATSTTCTNTTQEDCEWTTSSSTTWPDSKFGGHCTYDCESYTNGYDCATSGSYGCTYEGGRCVTRTTPKVCSDYKNTYDCGHHNDLPMITCIDPGTTPFQCKQLSLQCSTAVSEKECLRVYDSDAPFKNCSWDHSTNKCGYFKCTDQTYSWCDYRYCFPDEASETCMERNSCDLGGRSISYCYDISLPDERVCHEDSSGQCSPLTSTNCADGNMYTCYYINPPFSCYWNSSSSDCSALPSDRSKRPASFCENDDKCYLIVSSAGSSCLAITNTCSDYVTKTKCLGVLQTEDGRSVCYWNHELDTNKCQQRTLGCKATTELDCLADSTYCTWVGNTCKAKYGCETYSYSPELCMTFDECDHFVSGTLCSNITDGGCNDGIGEKKCLGKSECEWIPDSGCKEIKKTEQGLSAGAIAAIVISVVVVVLGVVASIIIVIVVYKRKMCCFKEKVGPGGEREDDHNAEGVRDDDADKGLVASSSEAADVGVGSGAGGVGVDKPVVVEATTGEDASSVGGGGVDPMIPE